MRRTRCSPVKESGNAVNSSMCSEGHKSIPRASSATLIALTTGNRDQLELWSAFAKLTIRAFTPEVMEELRTIVQDRPGIDLREHIPLLADIVSRHVRLAIDEMETSAVSDAPKLNNGRSDFREAAYNAVLSKSITPVEKVSNFRRSLSVRPSHALNSASLQRTASGFRKFGAVRHLSQEQNSVSSSACPEIAASQKDHASRSRALPTRAGRMSLSRPMRQPLRVRNCEENNLERRCSEESTEPRLERRYSAHANCATTKPAADKSKPTTSPLSPLLAMRQRRAERAKSVHQRLSKSNVSIL